MTRASQCYHKWMVRTRTHTPFQRTVETQADDPKLYNNNNTQLLFIEFLYHLISNKPYSRRCTESNKHTPTILANCLNSFEQQRSQGFLV